MIPRFPSHFRSERSARYAALGWAAFVFAVLSLPGGSVPTLSFRPFGIPPDLLVHAFLFAFLAFLTFRALTFSFVERRVPAALWWQSIARTFGVVVLYGAITELWQSFIPGRAGDAYDLLADTIGAMVGTLLQVWRKQYRFRGE